MSDGIIIRGAVLEDLPIICDLNQQIFHYEKQFGNTYDPNWTMSAEGQKYFRQRIKEKSSLVLVADCGGKAVGYLICYWDNWPFRKEPLMAELENMCVDEKYRRQGIGSLLMQEMFNHLRQKNINRLRVQTLAGNEAAANFYKKHGLIKHEITWEIPLNK